MFQRAVFDGHEYGIRFDYMDGKLLPVLRNGPLRGYFINTANHPHKGYWRFNKRLIDDEDCCAEWVVALAKAVGWDGDRAQQELNKALGKAPMAPGAFTFGIEQTIYPVSEDLTEFVVCGTIYHAAAMHVLKDMGGIWLNEAKGWHLKGVSLPMLVNNLVTQAGYTEEQVLIRNGSFRVVTTNVADANEGRPTLSLPMTSFMIERGVRADDERESGQVLAGIAPIQRTGLTKQQILDLIPDGMALPYQYEGAVFLAQQTGGLLADEMGIGKTRQSIFAAYAARLATKRRGVVIAAPKSTLRKWKREILTVYPKETVEVFTGNGVPDSDWIVTNYERLSQLVDCADRFAVIIIDEAHKMKEVGAGRTQSAFELAAKVPIRYLLSATPILNRESEIHSLLKLTGHGLGHLSLQDFTKRFGGSREFRNHLNAELNGRWMLRRLQSQVLRGLLPGKEHQFPLLKMEEEMAERYRDLVTKSTHALTRIHGVRRLLEEARIPVAMDYLKGMPSGEKMIVFTEYVESANLYAEALTEVGRGRFVILTGAESNDEKRDAAIQALQEDDEVAGIITTYGAGSEGIDLWRANHVFLGSQPWVPAIQAQAEDRANRLGQKRRVKVVAPLFEGTIDLGIRALLDDKNQIATEVLNPADAERMAIQKVSRMFAGNATVH